MLPFRYSTLFDYGLPENNAPPDPNDPDSHLVPRLVEKVALPLLLHTVQHAWQPSSPTGNRRMLAAVEEVLVYLEPSAEPAVQLLEAVEAKMRAAVEETEVRGAMGGELPITLLAVSDLGCTKATPTSSACQCTCSADEYQSFV